MYVITDYKDAKPKTVGQKAYNLFRLNNNFAIPEFAVISTEAFKVYQQEGDIPIELKEEFILILNHFLQKGRVAIRSSATAEDLPGVSFAGMYHTALNITSPDAALTAVIKTWNSVHSKRVKDYCTEMNIAPGEMAVIIQHQLQPEKSGVMVTQSPFSIKEVLIECCYGLGDKLVSGKINPARYRIKDKAIVAHGGDDILSDVEVFELTKMGSLIEEMFGSPQDIEWAIKEGKIFILQSRPVQVHSSKPRRKCTVWTNANVRETIPDPISPMMWSLFNTIAFPTIAIDVFGIPISRKRYHKFQIVDLLSGRMYWNVNNAIAYMKSIGPILDSIEGISAIDPQFLQAFKAVDTDDLPKPVPSLRMFFFTATSLIRLSYFILLAFVRFRWVSQKLDRMHEVSHLIYEHFKPVDSFKGGHEKIRIWLALVLKRFARGYFGGVLLSGIFLAILGRLLAMKRGTDGIAAARKTVYGILDKTGEMVIAINNLALVARKKIRNATVKNLKKLYKRDQEFRQSFDNFIDKYGHRGPAEFDIASRNWREDLDMVYKLIETAQDVGADKIDRKRFIKQMLAESSPFERFMLKIFLPRIEVYTPFRENGKHIYLKAIAKVKDQLLIMAKILKKKGFLLLERDIFFLTLQDIKGLCQNGFSKEEILKLVRVRKEEWEAYRQMEAPEIIYGSGERITSFVTSDKVLTGEPLSFGEVEGRARIIRSFEESSKLSAGEILITHHTDPGWTPLFMIAAGVIIETGGVICHAAMVARELGVPAVVIRGATTLIQDGQLVELDGNSGKVVLK